MLKLCVFITFLTRTIDVDRHANVTERFLTFCDMFALETRCSQKTDTLKILRDEALFAFRFARSPHLAVALGEFRVTVFVKSRGRGNAVRVRLLRETHRASPARNFLLLSGFTNASLSRASVALRLRIHCGVFHCGEIGKSTIALTKLDLSVSNQQLKTLSDVVEQANQQLVSILLLVSLEYRIYLSKIVRLNNTMNNKMQKHKVYEKNYSTLQ